MTSESRTDNASFETKLRNSCDTCATAKIKCTQEKPACAYCVKKLKVCVYGTSKRVRRTQRSHKQQKQQQQQQQEQEHQEQRRRRHHAASGSRSPRQTTTRTSTASPPPYPSLGAMTGAGLTSAQQSYPITTPPVAGQQDWPDFLAALMSPSITPFSTAPYTSAELDSAAVSLDTFTYVEDSYFDHSLPLSRPAQNHTSDRTGVRAARHGSSASGFVAGASEVVPGSLARAHGSYADETSLFPASPQTESGGTSSNSLANHSGARHCSPGRPSSSASRPSRPCQCLMRVLQFMAQLSMDPYPAWDAASDDEPPTSTPHPTSLELVSDGIEKMTDGISKIVQCSCSHDTSMAMLLLLIIYKIQVCYVDAVNAATSDEEAGGDTNFRPKPTPTSSWNDAHDDEDDDEHSGDEDQRRIFIQHILSTLAGLRALINRLSERLVEPNVFPSAARRPAVPQGPPYYSVVDGRIEVVPLSASSLRTLVSDLQNRLKGMSQAISEKLREV